MDYIIVSATTVSIWCWCSVGGYHL